ncbi:MAG: hypothetical protein B1H12_03070 [Desulfobacteraceae bacterium 4484_190.2]|nr:MAG: hypothetical protein B1H12_03070 [Desulfobacteraceae bacterium 4484_190.2]
MFGNWTFIFKTNPHGINATCEYLQNNVALMPYSPHKQCVPSEEIPIFFFGKELIIYLMHASRRILKDL